MMNRRYRYPFTASQWQELEHQALIFKYMVSGIPIPPDLLFSIKRSYLESAVLPPTLFPPHPQHGKLNYTTLSPSASLFICMFRIDKTWDWLGFSCDCGVPVCAVGWNCFQMGMGRKIDPEPGRCRRTDGKKWRCSKEAFPDSKYCERHMHRGKNRSRKPVEVLKTVSTITNSSNPSLTPTANSSITKNLSTFTPTARSSISSSSFSSLSSSDNQHYHPFLYNHTSSSRHHGICLSPQDTNTSLLLDSGSYSHTDADYRFLSKRPKLWKVIPLNHVFSLSINFK